MAKHAGRLPEPVHPRQRGAIVRPLYGPPHWPPILTYDAAAGTEHQGAPPPPASYALISTPARGHYLAISSPALVVRADGERRSAELGYWLAGEWWGKGVVS
ncbi:hypothetical protein MMC32_001791 [Xylographa parallela]|nr:hypothetical protein [Xylographa parallela]